MELDVVSQSDFDDLKQRFEALLDHLGLSQERCYHRDVLNAYTCERCRGTCVIFKEVNG